MHTYAIDTDERVLAVVLLGVTAALISAAAGSVVIAAHVVVPWYLGAPTPLAVFGILYKVFERWAWHLSAGPLRLSGVPYLTGRWIGAVQTTRDGQRLDLPVECFIRQSWQRMCVDLETATSSSSSSMASIDMLRRARPMLTYTYLNEPRANSSDAMQIHRGTASLTLSRDRHQLSGDYYSGRGRGSAPVQ